MITGRDIVCVASNWSESPTGKHHIMRRLCRANRVLWINYHASRRPRPGMADLRHALRRLCESAAAPAAPLENLRVATPLLLPWPESRVARAFNATRLRALVRSHLSRDGSRPAQLWLFTPDAPECIAAGAWESVVYCCVDEYSAFPGVNPGLIAALEQRTLAGSDVVFATSQPLLESRRRRHANAHLIEHGVDFEHFAQAHRLRHAPRPHDVRALRGPILGYFGLIADYVELELLAAVARSRPDWNIVLIGDVRTDTRVLHALPNVHLLGRKTYDELPAYCAAFDVGLIPFRAGRLTHAVNPIKLREYLAAGLPVISAPMPAVERYRPAVRIARSAAELVSAVEQAAAAADDPAAGAIRSGVRAESWDARVEQMSALVGACRRVPGAACPAPRA